MSTEDDVAGKLAEVLQRHANQGNVIPFPRKPKPRPVGSPITVLGDHNTMVVGSNNTVTVRVAATPRKIVIAEVKPGTSHINEAQAARLQHLVREVHRASGKSFQFVWTTLLDRLAVTRYRLIPAGSFEDAESYLLGWIGRFVPQDVPEDELRKRHIRYIKTNQKKFARTDGELAEFVLSKFGKTGLRVCTAAELLYIRRELVGAWLQDGWHKK